MSNQTNFRDKSESLAKINIQKLIVDGNMKMNGCLCTQAWLQNMVLEDSRPQIEGKLFIYWFLGRYDSLVLANSSALEMTELSNVLITENYWELTILEDFLLHSHENKSKFID